jgi:hypothetical protein
VTFYLGPPAATVADAASPSNAAIAASSSSTRAASAFSTKGSTFRLAGMSSVRELCKSSRRAV